MVESIGSEEDLCSPVLALLLILCPQGRGRLSWSESTPGLQDVEEASCLTSKSDFPAGTSLTNCSCKCYYACENNNHDINICDHSILLSSLFLTASWPFLFLNMTLLVLVQPLYLDQARSGTNVVRTEVWRSNNFDLSAFYSHTPFPATPATVPGKVRKGNLG